MTKTEFRFEELVKRIEALEARILELEVPRRLREQLKPAIEWGSNKLQKPQPLI